MPTFKMSSLHKNYFYFFSFSKGAACFGHSTGHDREQVQHGDEVAHRVRAAALRTQPRQDRPGQNQNINELYIVVLSGITYL